MWILGGKDMLTKKGLQCPVPKSELIPKKKNKEYSEKYLVYFSTKLRFVDHRTRTRAELQRKTS